jgi:hypothetical protein
MIINPPAERRGQFIWLPKNHREQYVRALRKRIQSGFYSGDQIISAITEKLAPIFDEQAERSA